MTKKQFYKSVILLAIPIALQNLLTALLNVFDQMMVGWLDGGMADKGLSAVLLANQIVFIFQIVVFAIANTTNIFIAQYTEREESRHLIKNRAGTTYSLILIVSAIFTAVCSLFPQTVIGLFNPDENYRALAEEFLRLVSFSFIPMGLSVGTVFMLRAVKRLKGALVINTCAVALNFFLNYSFMFGVFGIDGIGFLGAAYGTIVSRAVECVAMILMAIFTRQPIMGKIKEMFAFDGKFMKKFFAMFLPILCNEIFWVLCTTVYLFVYDKLENSTVVLASVNVAQSLDKIVSVVMIGSGSAVGVVMGNIVGSSDKKTIALFAKESIKFSLIAGGVVSVFTVLSAFVVPFVFTNATAQTHEMSKNLILLYALTAIIRTLGFTYVIGVLRSAGDTTFCMISETLILWLIGVPLVMIAGLVFNSSIYVVYLVSNIAEVIKVIAFALRANSGKWIKFAVEEKANVTPNE